MNRRSLLKRAGATVIGGLAAMVGIRPEKAEASPEWSSVYPDTPPYKLELHGPGEGPLRLWLASRFYVDLPEERYTDAVCVDWVVAEELCGSNRYYAECCVCPELGEPWEVFRMRRING